MKLWFKAKTYGYGWYACSWEGWAVILIYLAVVIGLIFVLKVGTLGQTGMIEYFVSVAAATAILIYVCFKKGERPRWRWGK
jgi:hypothetical protein